ncbi:MAG: hypothetical protein AB7E51_15010 [Pseudodesulfovibrio sp.]|uniref:hypothetical protein n=1 Tax=Pseudodesulfovibrio sp. TaxID=2035812 RepID=UPI003D148CBD
MKRLLCSIALIITMSIVAGCAMTQHQMDDYYGSWIGHHLDELIKSWGSPDRTSDLDDGSVVATYDGKCTVSVITTKDKIIENVSPKGSTFWCGDPYRSEEFFPKPTN